MQPVSGPYRILDSLYRIPVGSYTACIGSPLGRLQPWFFCVFCVFLRFLWSMGFRLQRPQCSNTKTRKKKKRRKRRKPQKTQKNTENAETTQKKLPVGSHTACIGPPSDRIQPVWGPYGVVYSLYRIPVGSHRVWIGSP